LAKTSQIARQKKRQKLVIKFQEKRKLLKEQGDYDGLSELPRNSNPVRLHSRCMVTGRARGYYRKFGISRLTFRKLALEGKIPGIRKASW
jgi:small subunit ribosomal protein S14